MRSVLPFYLTYLFSLSLGILCVALVCYWNYKWRGGFAWDGTGKQFNWHPVLMVAGLVVLYGNAAVLYRVPLTWGENKKPWKLLHASLLFMAFLMSVVGLCAVFDFHNVGHVPNLYSLHSWVGISTVILFTAQWVLGVSAFLVPASPLAFRQLVKPVHVWMGSMIFILSIIACISGINEKLIFSLNGNTNETRPYKDLPAEAQFANTLGLLIVAFGLVVLKMLSNQNWNRPEADQEEDASRPLLHGE